MVGFLALRHELNAWLLEEGGHIGYSVRPSRRREGHATRALALAVRRAAELGIDRALVTCDDDNAPRRARSSATAASTRTPATASGATGSTTGAGELSRWRSGRKNRSTRMNSCGSTMRGVDGERRHAAPQEQHLPVRLPGLADHLDRGVGAGQVEHEPAALLDDLELAVADRELDRVRAGAHAPDHQRREPDDRRDAR